MLVQWGAGLVALVVLALGGCAVSSHRQVPGPIEAEVRQTGHLPLAQVAILLPFFVHHEEVLARLRIRVLTKEESAITSALNMPAIVVLGETWEVIPGVLDADGLVRGRVFSWTQPRGAALWAHEAYHVQQFLADPAGFIWDVVQGICLSIQDGDLYEHQYFPYEVEAIAFERRVRAVMEGHQ